VILMIAFQKQVDKTGSKVNIHTVPRVMARLRETAQRTKEVLSANQECPVNIVFLRI
jgi:molecular chaperone DnaK (HSP70)